MTTTEAPPAPPDRLTAVPNNIAARMARFSARHRLIAVGGWLLFVAAATVLMSALGHVEAKDSDYANGESRRAEQIIEGAGFTERAGELVLIQSQELTTDAPAFQAAVREVTAAIQGTGEIENLQPAIVAADGHSTLIAFDMAGDAQTAADRVGPVLDAVAKVQGNHPDFTITRGGDASANKLIGESLDRDFGRLSMLSIPVTIGILIVAFGALLAAFLPVGLALTSIVAALGLLALASRLFPTVDSTTHVMLLVGLAVGVDYCLFYIRREREERAKGADPQRALSVAAATAGRSVLVSGITVIIAMAGMFLTGNVVFVSFASATLLVVATAVLGSLTVLPALLSKLGDRVDLGRVPGLYRRSSDSRVWRA